MPNHRFESAFAIGDTVYLKTDTEQSKHIVTGYIVRPGGRLIYLISCCNSESHHFDIELTPERDIMMTTSN